VTKIAFAQKILLLVTAGRLLYGMQTVTHPLAEESDAGLLLLIGAASDSPEDRSLADAAMREFHGRHFAYVLGVVRGFAENFGTVVIDTDLFAARTFEKAFRVAQAFRDEGDGATDRSRQKMRAWLGKIASNLARDELRRVSRHRNGVQIVPLLDEIDCVADASMEFDASPTDSVVLAALREELDILKPEDRDIVMTYASFGIPTSNGRELPMDVREALEHRTGYERSNVRQKWKRLSDRLKNKLEPILSNTHHPSRHE
jgi:DNA-directed RNA polymerase specialized sigma24 family protein